MANEAPAATTPLGTSPQPGPAAPPAAGGTPAAPETQPKSTTETLFPDFIDENGALMNSPRGVTEVIPGEMMDPNPVVDKGPQAPAPKATDPGASQYIDTSMLDGKLVKVKVDGVEIDVPAASLVKNYQLEAHLTQKGQRLAEQEKILQDVLKDAVNRQPTPKPGAADAPPADPADDTRDPSLVKMEQELKRTQEELAQVNAATRHIRVEQGLKAIDADIRQSVGFDDFLAYAPKITEFAKSQCKDPAHPTPQEVALYDTPMFYRTKYLEMKAKDMAAGKTPTPPTPAPAGGQPPAAGAESRPAPNISVETGAGSPAIEKPENSWNARYKAALQRAVQTGDLNDWATVSRLKHEPVGSR